jgi:hypothetical protein
VKYYGTLLTSSVEAALLHDEEQITEDDKVSIVACC